MALTRFTFEADGVLIEGEGVVTITGAPPADPSTVIVEFLNQLDAPAIEAEALTRMGWGDECQTAKVIEVLRMLATGKGGDGG